MLLSLSGDDYRNNDVTGNDGVLKFESLFPGSYYVRPMLKEYEFSPKSNSLTWKAAAIWFSNLKQNELHSVYLVPYPQLLENQA